MAGKERRLELSRHLGDREQEKENGNILSNRLGLGLSDRSRRRSCVSNGGEGQNDKSKGFHGADIGWSLDLKRFLKWARQWWFLLDSWWSIWMK